MGRIREWLTDALSPPPSEEAPQAQPGPRVTPDPAPPTDPVEALVAITVTIDWVASPGRLELRRDRQVWFYLQGSSWLQGTTNYEVSAKAESGLWAFYEEIIAEEARAARKAVLDNLMHFRIIRED